MTDVFSLSISFGCAILLRKLADDLLNRPLEPIAGYGYLILLNILIIIFIFALMGLYRGSGIVAVIELRRITLAVITAYIILTFSTYIIGEGSHLSRIIFILSLLFCLVFIPFFRFVLYNRFSRFRTWGVKVVVIASQKELQDITQRLLKIQRLGFNPEILLQTAGGAKEENGITAIPVKRYSPEECRKIKAEGITIAFYTSENLSENDPVLAEISQIFPTIYYVLPESNLSSLWLESCDLSGRPALKVRYHLLEKLPNICKQIIEVCASIFLLLILLPLYFLIIIALLIENKGPVFFTQIRLGQNAKPFNLIKFRTMDKDAEQVLEKYLVKNPSARAEYEQYHKLDKDPRITPVGSLLRKFSLDELPQMVNVVKGDMNLIGPRAYMISELDLNDEVTRAILRVKPGLTGWWQVTERNYATFKERQKLDLYYIDNWSLWMDYYILIKTIWILISGSGK